MGFTDMANEQLDGVVRQFIQEHGFVVGSPIINGYLRSFGIQIQRHRLRSSIGRVDPVNVTRECTLFQDPTVCGIYMGISHLVKWGIRRSWGN